MQKINLKQKKVYLHLCRLAIDELARGDDTVKNDGALFARVHDDIVDLALDHDGGALTPVDVDRLVSLCLRDGEGVGWLDVILHHPLLAVQLEPGWLGRL